MLAAVFALQSSGANPSAIEQLPSDDVHVWLAFLPKIHDVALLDAYGALLSTEERQRQAQFRVCADRHSYLVTHALLRAALSRYTPIDPRAWRFVTNGYGRPEVANTDPSVGRMNFSVSHARGLVAVAVTRAQAVGIDVEEARACPAPMEVANRYFARKENLALGALPEDRQSERFYEYWTLKEAYIKARGLGLSVPLDQFSFQFEGDQVVRLSVEPSLQDRPEIWKFWQFRPSADHVLALCVHRRPPLEPRLICRSCIPLVRDELLEPIAARESA